ncbi:hypothetical protein LIER_06308 [Lithospermum erythrorhizon]|uniref:Uncharacterized protein n=1 Tax=Lithospermum erythrorhizon TaxID=34254 RepID=A0AAV3P8J8_LITER
MASISITKTTISRVSSLLNQRPSISRVCFCSASNLPQGQKPISGDTRDDEYKKYAVGSSMEEMVNKADDIETKQNEEMKDKNSEMSAKAKNRTSILGHDIKEGTERPMNNLGKKAKHRVQDSWDLARETTQKIKQTVVGKSGGDHEK